MHVKHFAALAILGVAAWTPAALAGDVLVSAASSLTNAFKALAVQYHAEHPETAVLMNFGASDVVLQQIINGAPVDVFASADRKAMDKAVVAGAVDAASRTDFAKNELVLIVPADSTLGIRSVKDLNRADVRRITLGNPASVPVGRYSKAALKQANAWAALESKLIVAQNVRQALDYVARNEVDAGFVFATDAAIMPDKVKVVQTLDTPVPVLYPIALVQQRNINIEARAFVEYVLSPQGQATLAEYGFGRP